MNPLKPESGISRRHFNGLVAGAALVGAPRLRAQSGNRIVLGQSAAFTGAAAQLGIQFHAGAKLFFDQLNAQGGVNGQRVEIAQLDDGYEPDRCVENTNKLLGSEVFALFGYIGTPTSLAALPLATKAQVPFFAPFTGAMGLRQPFNKLAFHLRASYNDETALIVRQLTGLGLNNIAVFHQNDAYGKAGLDGVTLADLERSDDSGSRRSQARPEEINQIVLMDAGGWFASKGVNRLSLWAMSAQGGAAPAAGAQARNDEGSATAVPTAQVRTPGWSTWTKRSQPIHSGPYSLVGDPSVIKDGQRYRMYYTCFDPRRKGPAICQATSEHGYDWTDVQVSKPVPGLMIEARPGRWDDAHETPYALKYRGTYFLYFVGYRDKGGFAKSFPAYLGLATSTDGVHFTREDEPIVKTTPQGYDNDAVFSPSIVPYQGELVMIYTGHCWTNCPKGKGVFLMAATSSDGKNWVKRPAPILDKKALPAEVKDGAAESEIVLGPDGMYYLFMSWLYGNGTHDIGVARSASPFGPWVVNPLPIVKRPAEQKGFDDVGPIAPSVLIEDGKVRMWFHGFSKRKSIEIGYAQAPWPLKLPP